MQRLRGINWAIESENRSESRRGNYSGKLEVSQCEEKRRGSCSKEDRLRTQRPNTICVNHLEPDQSNHMVKKI